MFTGIAYAAQPAGSPGGFGAFMPIIVLFAIFYFLLIRPQQKRAKEHQATLEALKSGDTVITNGGLYGTVIKIDGQVSGDVVEVRPRQCAGLRQVVQHHSFDRQLRLLLQNLITTYAKTRTSFGFFLH